MSEIDDTIVLSSDEESPPKKKVKSILLGNMTGITITPVKKPMKEKKKQPDICIISDEDELSEEKSSDEDIEINDTCEQTKNSQNIESDRKNGIEKSINVDYEMVPANEAAKVIDITDVEDYPKNNEENDDVIELEDKNEEENETDLGGVVDEILEKGDNNLQCENQIANNKDQLDEKCQNEVEKSNLVQHEKKSFSMGDTVNNSAVSFNKIRSMPCDQSPKETYVCKLSSSELVYDFLATCKKNLENTEYNLNNQFDMLEQYYKKCDPKFVESDDFKKFIEINLKKAKVSSPQAVISFGEVFAHLKDLNKMGTVEVTKKNKLKLKKMEHTIKLLVKKIKELENADVDFSDEEDSSYIKLNRYIIRLNKLYLKFCEYLKSNPYSGRITYSKLNFVDSNYNEVNRAISKKYKDNRKFPSYIEMENFIKKIAEQNKLELSEAEIKVESQHCFKRLGELLQTRRKRELYEMHSLYIQDGAQDPASNDSTLQTVLESNFSKAQKEIDELCQQYVKRQDHGEEPDDSDNNTESSDNENEKTP